MKGFFFFTKNPCNTEGSYCLLLFRGRLGCYSYRLLVIHREALHLDSICILNIVYVPLKYNWYVLQCILRLYYFITAIALWQIKHMGFSPTQLNRYFTVHSLLHYSFSSSSFSLFDVDNMLVHAERVSWIIGGLEGRDKKNTFLIGGNWLALVLAQKQLIIYVILNNLWAIWPAGHQMNEPALCDLTIVLSVRNYSFIEFNGNTPWIGSMVGLF